MMRTPEIERAVEVLQVFTQSDHERERYLSRLKAQRDYQSGLSEAREEGQQEGMLLGRVALLQRQGTKKFGRLPAGAKRRLAALSDPAAADALAERLLDATSWQDWLGPA